MPKYTDGAFMPVNFVNFDPAPDGRGLDMLLKGASMVDDAYEKYRQRQEEEAALNSPLIQQIISGVVGADTAMAPLPPTVRQQALSTNDAAGVMGPFIGQDVPVKSGNQPWYPDEHLGELADAEAALKRQGNTAPESMRGADPTMIYSSNVAPPGMAMPGRQWSVGSGPGTQFGEDINVSAPSAMTPRAMMGGAALSQRAPLTPGQLRIIEKLAPYYTQMAAVKESGKNRINAQREEQTFKGDQKAADRAVKLLDLNLKRLRDLAKNDLDWAKLKAKAKTGGGKGQKDLIEALRKSAKDAQDAMDEAQGIVTSLDQLGGSAAEPGSPLRQNYDRARQQFAAAQDFYQKRNSIYVQALGSLDAKVTGPTAKVKFGIDDVLAGRVTDEAEIGRIYDSLSPAEQARVQKQLGVK